MAHDRLTLLARLAPMFGPQTENLAVEALGHILSESEAARSALSELLQASGAEVGKVALIRTQDAGEDGAKPDLAGLNEDDELRVLIEAKFWAGLRGEDCFGHGRCLASRGRGGARSAAAVPETTMAPAAGRSDLSR